MTNLPSGLDARVGMHVRVRKKRWTVTNVERFDACSVVTLRGIDADNGRHEEQVLAPFDDVCPIVPRRRPRIVSASTWRRACGALIANQGASGALRAARTAGMHLLPHQLEPALALVHGKGCRLLIADEVGLGKTVQAGLAVAELMARGAAARALILTPAGLREQWAGELSSRFGIGATVVDSPELRRQQARLPIGGNPWTATPVAIASLDFAKRPEALPAIQLARWDIVIVDEVHEATEGSDRHAAVSALCADTPYVLLLSATPHSGDAAAFRSIRALGGPESDLLIFRRTRQELGLDRRRRVHRLHVAPNEAERRMQACLRRFESAVLREHGRGDSSVALALATLRKRAFSSAHALAASVARRLADLAEGRGPTGEQLPLPLDDAGETIEDDGSPVWRAPALSDARAERRLLSRLLEAASAAAVDETKLTVLGRILRRVAEPVIVFTEYRDTLFHVRDTVARGAVLLHGGLSRQERRAALSRFPATRILLATDAAGQGLNLHDGCRMVINLELPWNPARLEQRIGRVDRIGQTRTVHAFHLVAAGRGEESMLERLATRIARARREIGAADPLGTGDGEPDTPPAPPLFRMAAEAAAERERLQEARKIHVAAAHTTNLAEGPLIAFARRRGTRARLGSNILVLGRSSAVDVTGRVVALGVPAALVRSTGWSARRLADLDILVSRLHTPEQEEWLIATIACHQAFWQARLHRERFIAARLERERGGAHQPGLFDRRSDQARLAEENQRRDARAESARRIRQAESLAALEIQLLSPALVLLP